VPFVRERRYGESWISGTPSGGRRNDGRWLAEVLELPGVRAYGESEDVALSKVQALALRVVAERLEHGEAGPELLTISFNAA
jgi:predicted RNase H-like HicB family nuclease